MSKRVRTLLRVSSRQQLHDDDIPIQRAEAEQFIAKQKDWVFDKEYLEKGISAYHNGVDDREVLQEIMQDAKRGEFEILLAYMSDRIGRQEEYSFYVAELNRMGIEVWTIKDGQLKNILINCLITFAFGKTRAKVRKQVCECMILWLRW